MDFYLIIYFLIGVLQDFIWTLNMRYITKDRTILAGLSSFVGTVLTMIVLYQILTRLEETRGIFAIISYALGIGIGTVLGMRMKIKDHMRR